MKILLLLLFLIPNLVVARVCTVYITSEFEVGSDKVKECNFEKGDIMKITAEGSSFGVKNNALVTRDFHCDFSQTISVVEWDTPPTLNISCVYKGWR
tara:strand:- start:177 stop:467 length:291 start_codon:yes stop_codon:yes gene_type:complete